MKQGIYVLIIMLLNSCGNSEMVNDGVKSSSELAAKVDSILKLEHFRREATYEPLSLSYKGKPILNLGQKVENLDSTLSFRHDPNGKYWDINLVKDHLSVDDNLSIELKQGSINGILFFSSDQIENQIFRLSGYWTIGTELTENNKDEIIKQITEKLFPILKDKLQFESGWSFENKEENYVEHSFFN